MVYAYCRCSTCETRQDIDRQIRELKEMGATAKTIFKEYESGTKVTEKPEILFARLDAKEILPKVEAIQAAQKAEYEKEMGISAEEKAEE